MDESPLKRDYFNRKCIFQLLIFKWYVHFGGVLVSWPKITLPETNIAPESRTSKCASRYSGVQFFISELNSHLRTRRFTEVTFRPSPPTNHWKTQHFATSLTFRACGSSFYGLSRNCIFFLLTLFLFSAVSSSDSAALLCFFNCPYCRKLDFFTSFDYIILHNVGNVLHPSVTVLKAQLGA